MTATVADFRAKFPEFNSSTTFPTSQIEFWLDVAYKMLNASRWGNMLDVGAMLYTAHNIVLEGRAQSEASGGNIPGFNRGIVNSKSVDKVSVGYDTSHGTEEGAGHWNLTIYGSRLYRYIKMFGAGPIQIGIGDQPPLSGPAWPGPDTSPGWNNF